MSESALQFGGAAFRKAGSPVANPQDDQATRLRALMEAIERPPLPRPARPEPRQPPPIRHHTELFGPRARIVAFSSGKGGVGKTNTCVNLSIALSALGKRTTLLDADLGLANADVLCGLTPTKRLETCVGLQHANGAARGPGCESLPATMREIALEAPGGFRLIPGAAGIARMAELNQEQRARLFAGLAELERDSDLVLIDTAAGLSRDVLTFMHIADLGVVVATPEPTSITDAYAVIKCALTERPLAQRAHHLRAARTSGAPGALRQPMLALVVNQVADEREAVAVHTRIAAACSRFLDYQLPFLGWVADDPKVTAAVRKRRPLLLEAPRARASDDLRRLALALAKAVEPERAGSKPRRRGLTRILARIVLRER
jgi:flagellar biosynthesis protein FlhG